MNFNYDIYLMTINVDVDNNKITQKNILELKYTMTFFT